MTALRRLQGNCITSVPMTSVTYAFMHEEVLSIIGGPRDRFRWGKMFGKYVHHFVFVTPLFIPVRATDTQKAKQKTLIGDDVYFGAPTGGFYSDHVRYSHKTAIKTSTAHVKDQHAIPNHSNGSHREPHTHTTRRYSTLH